MALKECLIEVGKISEDGGDARISYTVGFVFWVILDLIFSTSFKTIRNIMKYMKIQNT